VDSLTYTRQLREKGVEVYFEREKVGTFTENSEMILTILSSIAQEESNNMSQNIRWGMRKAMADGAIYLPYKSILGYEKGEDDKPQIVPKEAETIRLIYRRFLEGGTFSGIARTLTEMGIPSPMRKEKWQPLTVKNILTNEIYKGDKLLQKQFTVDFLTRTRKKNEGELPQHYLTESHDAIIPPAEWEEVQAEIKRRSAIGARKNIHPFASKIRCGVCGGWFGSKVWHSNSKYRRIIWQCNAKYGKGTKCQTPHVTEAEVKAAFVPILSSVLADKGKRVTALGREIKALRNTAAIDKEIEATERIIDQTEQALHDTPLEAPALVKQHDKAIKKQAELERQKAEQLDRAEELEASVKVLEDCTKAKYDEKVWLALVDYVEVGEDGQIAIILKK